MGDGDPEYDRYLVALRRPNRLRDLVERLDAKLARAADFAASAVRFDRLASDEALLLDRLDVLIVRARAADLEALAERPEWRDVLAVQRERSSTVSVDRGDDDPPEGFNEAAFAWGLQVTGVAESRLTGHGVRVAVLDSALDLCHPDFSLRRTAIVTHSLTGTRTQESPCIHGTAVTGVIGGPQHPSEGPRYGVAPECSLFFGRVLTDTCGYDDGWLVAGIEWALAQRCRLVNLSLGRGVQPGDPPGPVYEEICNRAANLGLMVIAAAGNDSSRHLGIVKPVGEPANCLNAFAVGAINLKRQVASFSNGAQNPNGGAVDLVAPGQSIRSAAANALSGEQRYSRFHLTSMATPFVTGIAALWLQKEPDLTVRQLWDRLTETASRMPDRSATGAGLVQAPPE